MTKFSTLQLFDDLEVQGKSLCKQQTSAESYNIDCSPGGDASRLDENLNSPKKERCVSKLLTDKACRVGWGDMRDLIIILRCYVPILHN